MQIFGFALTFQNSLGFSRYGERLIAVPNSSSSLGIFYCTGYIGKYTEALTMPYRTKMNYSLKSTPYYTSGKAGTGKTRREVSKIWVTDRKQRCQVSDLATPHEPDVSSFLRRFFPYLSIWCKDQMLITFKRSTMDTRHKWAKWGDAVLLWRGFHEGLYKAWKALFERFVESRETPPPPSPIPAIPWLLLLSSNKTRRLFCSLRYEEVGYVSQRTEVIEYYDTWVNNQKNKRSRHHWSWTRFFPNFIYFTPYFVQYYAW